MMVESTIFTQEGGTPMARCLNCGDIVDTVVISNRRRSLPGFCKKHGKKAA